MSCFIADNFVYYKPVSDVNLNVGNLGDELYMYYCSDYVSETYNRKNNAATYLAYDVFSPITSFAIAPYDYVPYSEWYKKNYPGYSSTRTTVYEYVMFSNEKHAADLNAGILLTNDKYRSKGDNRITMFVARFDNTAKPSAEITGGWGEAYSNLGSVYQKYDKENAN